MPVNIFEHPGKPQRRVVVTGVSAITPLGLNLNQTWKSLIQGESGIGLIKSFDSEPFDVKIAGEIKDFDPNLYVHKKEQKKMDRFIQLTMACGEMAMQDSGLEIGDELAHRSGCIVGVGLGGLPRIHQQVNIFEKRGPSRISHFFIPSVIANLAPGQLSMKYNLKHLNYTTTSACSSGAHAIGEAFNYIRSGKCDVMVAGGAESTVTELAVAGFSSMKALSLRNDSPKEASRPWDQDRDGFVLSEGASLLILEDYEHASRRGAKIYAEVLGYGSSSDAYHMTTPSPGGSGASMSMHNALQDANITPDKINYINAHGTSTPAGDEIECEAIKRVFKDHAKQKLLVSSTKSSIGHALGAAGAVESAICIKALENQIAPPTLNLDNPSPGCDLDFVPHCAKDGKIDFVLNSSFGFGGTNATLIFGRRP